MRENVRKNVIYRLLGTGMHFYSRETLDALLASYPCHKLDGVMRVEYYRGWLANIPESVFLEDAMQGFPQLRAIQHCYGPDIGITEFALDRTSGNPIRGVIGVYYEKSLHEGLRCKAADEAIALLAAR